MAATAIDRARSDLVAATLGLLTVGGLYADGWAHLNVGGLETFFTPWHALLYGNFTLLVAWIGWSTWRHRPGDGARRGVIPTGYGLGVVGIMLFALGGVLDMVWHLLFGIEVGIEALVSPTHLVLLIGAALLLSSPIRSAMADRSPSALHSWAVVLGVASVAALAAFFLSYLSVFTEPQSTLPLTTIPEAAPGHKTAELATVAGLGGYLITTLLLALPVDYLRRTGRLPAGALTVIVIAVAAPAAALNEFAYLWPLVGAVIAAAVVDAAARYTERRILVALLIGAVWAGQLAGLAAMGELRWPVELWAGVAALSTLLALGISLINGGQESASTLPHDNAKRLQAT